MNLEQWLVTKIDLAEIVVHMLHVVMIDIDKQRIRSLLSHKIA